MPTGLIFTSSFIAADYNIELGCALQCFSSIVHSICVDIAIVSLIMANDCWRKDFMVLPNWIRQKVQGRIVPTEKLRHNLSGETVIIDIHDETDVYFKQLNESWNM